jgi:hypothetical protein
VAIAKLNETVSWKLVGTDDNCALWTTPGAVGIVDVYSINSSVKVLRVDGKLPFDVGYAFKELICSLTILNSNLRQTFRSVCAASLVPLARLTE